jgi:hypothetical protein
MNLKKSLKEKNCIGEWVHFHEKDKKNNEYRGICVDEVKEISEDYAHRLQKIIWFEQRLLPKKEWKKSMRKKFPYITIRACYYVIKSNKSGLVFGQFCMNSYQNIVKKLFKEAEKKGFFRKINNIQMEKEIKEARINLLKLILDT